MDHRELWDRFREHYFFDRQRHFAMDISRMSFAPGFLSGISDRMQRAFVAMDGLEAGQIANPDEKRMVGHYWLRDAKRAPSADLRKQIDDTIAAIKKFASDVHSSRITTARGGKFKHLLVVGIGGSALGPQFVAQALGNSRDAMDLYFFDNTDPDGMQNELSRIPSLADTLCVVISKSGGTKETRNGQLIAKHAFDVAGLPFAKHFVAVTGEGSELDRTAVGEKWLARFPMWDWVGGRTSELSAVGLLPAALQGYSIDELLRGAREMDEITRIHDMQRNPAALLAAMWFYAGSGKGTKDMVVLPYKDRLELFSRYLQQLVMESLGKEKDLSGQVVNQGIAVYGNKGSTDQHAYVQQLREGLNNFFTVFIEVLRDDTKLTTASDSPASRFEVEPGITCGDYLQGFYLGTRSALFENKRESVSITINEVSPYAVGQLIALFERAVGLYASLINVNAYHQPGVEAGKKAAAKVLELQSAIMNFMRDHRSPQTVALIAEGIKQGENVESVFKIARHLAANGRLVEHPAERVFDSTYTYAN